MKTMENVKTFEKFLSPDEINDIGVHHIFIGDEEWKEINMNDETGVMTLKKVGASEPDIEKIEINGEWFQILRKNNETGVMTLKKL